jgi:Tol biopolymer transport system component
VYKRLPPGYDQTPTPEGFYLDPYQAWVARTDGSEARRLGDYCLYISDVIWLKEEQEIIFSCSYEGPGDIRWASVDGSRKMDFGLMGPMALSPDESLLAFIDSENRLQIAALDGSEIRLISRVGWGFSWSQDSRRLYYSYFEECGADSANIHVYDWETGEDKEVVASPVMTAEGQAVTIERYASLAVSPLENAAILEYGKLWLVQWAP